MYNAETQIQILADLGERKTRLVHTAISMNSVPKNGTCIVIDNANYSPDIYPAWGVQGLHMNIKNGREDLSPPFLYELQVSCKFSNIVWVSERVTHQDENLVWVLSHELQHLQQDLRSNVISKAGFFLYYTLGEVIPNALNLDVPTELDSELHAWRTLSTVLGKDKADQFMAKNAREGQMTKSFNRLLNMDPNADYDVVNELIAVFKEHKDKLNDIQTISDDDLIKNFDIDYTVKSLESIK